MTGHDVADLRDVDQSIEGRHELVARKTEDDLGALGAQLAGQRVATGQCAGRRVGLGRSRGGCRHLDIVSMLNTPARFSSVRDR